MFERFTRERARGGRAGAGRGARDRAARGSARPRCCSASPAATGRARGCSPTTAPRYDALRARVVSGGLDGEALAAIGIDLDEIRRRAEANFGPGALERGAAPRGSHVPFTAQAQEGARARAARGDRGRRQARSATSTCCSGCCARAAPRPLLRAVGRRARRAARRRSARRRVVADAERDLLVRAGGERLLAGAVGVGLGRQRRARPQPGEHRAARRAGSGSSGHHSSVSSAAIATTAMNATRLAKPR